MLRKHSVNISGHQTSFSIEDEFYLELKRIARERSLSLSALVEQIDSERDPARNLSSILRVFVLNEVKSTVQQD